MNFNRKKTYKVISYTCPYSLTIVAYGYDQLQELGYLGQVGQNGVNAQEGTVEELEIDQKQENEFNTPERMSYLKRIHILLMLQDHFMMVTLKLSSPANCMVEKRFKKNQEDVLLQDIGSVLHKIACLQIIYFGYGCIN